MPDKTFEDKENEKWITVGGKKIQVDTLEDAEEKTREKLPSARGEKESATKEALKAYESRFGLIKGVFKIREEVVFDKYNKTGIISGLDGEFVKILIGNRIVRVEKNHVFKKSELLGDCHWDTLTKADRVKELGFFNISKEYSNQNWGNLPYEIREHLLKNVSPAGTTTSTTGIHNPVYNPINEEKSVSDRIDEEIKRQHEDTNKDEKKPED